MIKAYLLILLAVILWKGCYVWKRGMRVYRQDRHDHNSLYEYLLGNGATHSEAIRPFVNHALVRAFKPLLGQWRLFLILVVLGLLVVWLG